MIYLTHFLDGSQYYVTYYFNYYKLVNYNICQIKQKIMQKGSNINEID